MKRLIASHHSDVVRIDQRNEQRPNGVKVGFFQVLNRMQYKMVLLHLVTINYRKHRKTVSTSPQVGTTNFHHPKKIGI